MNWTEEEYQAYLARRYQAYLDRQRQPTPTRTPGDANEDESSLRGRLLTVSKPHGWLHYHTHDSRKSAPGWPDDAFVRAYDALILMELKDRYRKPSPEQATWLSVLGTVTRVETYLVRPDNYAAMAERLSRRLGDST